MRHIYQRYNSDCYPTCVAMVLGVSHKHALKLVHPNHVRGNSYESIMGFKIRLFHRFGYRIIKRNPKSLLQLKHNAILEVGYSLREQTHAVVWDAQQKKVLDPDWAVSHNRKYYENRLLRAFELRKLK
jgi:hypothetical protein